MKKQGTDARKDVRRLWRFVHRMRFAGKEIRGRSPKKHPNEIRFKKWLKRVKPRYIHTATDDQRPCLDHCGPTYLAVSPPATSHRWCSRGTRFLADTFQHRSRTRYEMPWCGQRPARVSQSCRTDTCLDFYHETPQASSQWAHRFQFGCLGSECEAMRQNMVPSNEKQSKQLGWR